jgi:hypothetical protein
VANCVMDFIMTMLSRFNSNKHLPPHESHVTRPGFRLVTRLQYINSHIMLGNRCVLQQQHVDCKVADALLKKGTK